MNAYGNRNRNRKPSFVEPNQSAFIGRKMARMHLEDLDELVDANEIVLIDSVMLGDRCSVIKARRELHKTRRCGWLGIDYIRISSCLFLFLCMERFEELIVERLLIECQPIEAGEFWHIR